VTELSEWKNLFLGAWVADWLILFVAVSSQRQIRYKIVDAWTERRSSLWSLAWPRYVSSLVMRRGGDYFIRLTKSLLPKLSIIKEIVVSADDSLANYTGSSILTKKMFSSASSNDTAEPTSIDGFLIKSLQHENQAVPSCLNVHQ
jgi:hypothetical protein